MSIQEDITTRRRYIFKRLRKIHRNAPSRELTSKERDEWNDLTDEFDRLRRLRDEMEMRGQRIEEVQAEIKADN